VKRRFNSRSGATAIEYALIAGAVALLIITGAATIGNKTADKFEAVSAGFN
jgi:pilus assembly protein Flp/PilA